MTFMNRMLFICIQWPICGKLQSCSLIWNITFVRKWLQATMLRSFTLKVLDLRMRILLNSVKRKFLITLMCFAKKEFCKFLKFWEIFLSKSSNRCFQVMDWKFQTKNSLLIWLKVTWNIEKLYPYYLKKTQRTIGAFWLMKNEQRELKFKTNRRKKRRN